MLKLEDIRKDAQIRGIQADEWKRVAQACGSVKALPTSGSAGILPAYWSPGVSAAKNSIDSSSPYGSAGVSPANERAQAKSAKGWYSRNYLPHLDSPGLLQMITCRLADALPAQAIERIKQQTSNDIERQKKIEAWLDAGHGSCHLRDPANAAIIEQAFWHFDGERYHLLAWCVMPNHFHVLIETLPQHPLAAIIHSWKSYSSRYINKRLGRTGTFWQREYFDRYIRDDQHLAAVIRYIHLNPVHAGLCQKAEDWAFGSARFERDRAG